VVRRTAPTGTGAIVLGTMPKGRIQSRRLEHTAGRESEDVMSRETPEQVLKSIVDGINSGNLDALMTLYEAEAAFAAQPGSWLTAWQVFVNRWLHSLR
jgi:hypothetical protein